jgi:hypothetical protein
MDYNTKREFIVKRHKPGEPEECTPSTTLRACRQIAINSAEAGYIAEVVRLRDSEVVFRRPEE